jgi:hypothetical protein
VPKWQHSIAIGERRAGACSATGAACSVDYRAYGGNRVWNPEASLPIGITRDAECELLSSLRVRIFRGAATVLFLFFFKP